MLTRHLLYDKSTQHLWWHSQKSAHYSIYYVIYCRADLFYCRATALQTREQALLFIIKFVLSSLPVVTRLRSLLQSRLVLLQSESKRHFLRQFQSQLSSHFTMCIYCRADYLDCRVLTRNSSSKLICRLDTNCVTREQALLFIIKFVLSSLPVVTVESWQFIRVVNWYADYTPIVWREHADFSLWRYSHSLLAT